LSLILKIFKLNSKHVIFIIFYIIYNYLPINIIHLLGLKNKTPIYEFSVEDLPKLLKEDKLYHDDFVYLINKLENLTRID
jgi:hypothetical protein